MALIIDSENLCISFKIWWDSGENKDKYLMAFFNHLQLPASCTFLLVSVFFFYFMPLFSDRKDILIRVWTCILVVITGHLFENPNVFYFFKVLHVLKFYDYKRRKWFFFRRIKYYHMVKQNFTNLQKFKCCSLRSKLAIR